MKTVISKKTLGFSCLVAAVLVLYISPKANSEEKGQKSDLAAKALGVSTDKKHQHTKEQAALAREIGKEVVCLCGTCPKRTITSCECGWAIQNQNALVNAVASGNSKEKIIETYRQVYGDQVLSLLPNEGFAVTAWALPYTFALFAFFVILVLGFRFARKPSTITAMTAEAPEVAPNVTDDDEAKAVLARELEDLD